MEKEKTKISNKTATNNYGDTEYWDTRYSKKKDQRFQWLETYDRLKPIIEGCLLRGKQSKILNIGCGNSSIQEYLYEDGYRNIVGNDISSVVIQQMKESQQQKGYLQMSYDVMDVRSMTYPNQYFDLVIDKSTIDSLMCSDCPLINVAKMIQESYRVLRNGGYYLAISYSSSRLQHLVRKHVSFDVKLAELARQQETGHLSKNYLYICRKLPMEALSKEWEDQFYKDLKIQELKEYPPV